VRAPIEDVQVKEPNTGNPPRRLHVTTAEGPPRTHTPCAGRVTGPGRSPDSRVNALAPPSRDHPSGMSEKGSSLTVAGAAPGLATVNNGMPHRLPS